MTATNGAWVPVPPADNAIGMEKIRSGALSIDDHRDLFPLHAVLLHTGNVLLFSGHTETLHYATVSFVFKPVGETLVRVPFPGNLDFFCCHYVQIEDGRILVVGGSDPDFHHRGSVGAKNVAFFEPTTAGGTWTKSPHELKHGRWYPTAVLLGDGRVLVFSGRREHGGPSANASIADRVEVLTPPDYKPEFLTGADLPLPLYPGLHLAPDGRVYYTHTNWGQEITDPPTRALTVTGPTTGAWATVAGGRPSQPRREEGMSVLLPPAQDGKILVVGGSLAQDSAHQPVAQDANAVIDHIGDHTQPGTELSDPKSAEILTTGATPSWGAAPGGGATVHPRINGHLVLLPDATVLVCGGHNFYKWSPNPDTTATLPAEIFTPSGAGAGFRAVAAMTQSRMYHSTALLLPDGRVMVNGGAEPNATEPTPAGGFPGGWPSELNWTGLPLNRKTRQFYRPPYLFKGTQPTITEIKRSGARTRQIPYDSTFVVETPQAADIRAVALMRPGAPTHHTDSEQRYVPLAFTRAGNELTVTMLATVQSSVVPPGFYMLWIVDDQKRPCQRAEFVQVPGPARPRPVTPSGGGSCFSMILLASAGAFATTRALRRSRG